jgi:hypothetical protein
MIQESSTMLRRLLGTTLLLAVLAGLASVDALAQDLEKKGPAARDSATLPAGDYTGRLKTTPASDRTFIVTVEEKKLVPTGRIGTGPRMVVPRFPGFPSLNSALNNLLNKQKAYNNAVSKVNTAKSVKSRNSALQNLQKAGFALQQAALAFKQVAVAAEIRNTAILNNVAASRMPQFRIDVKKTDVEFQSREEVKVRTMVLPEQFDEKGNVKKYTKEELNELKGKDKKAVGYESSIEKLEPGQVVKVTLAPALTKAAAKDGAKEKLVAVGGDKKMQARQIVILSDAGEALPKGKRKKD